MWDAKRAERVAKIVGLGVTLLCIVYLVFLYESPDTTQRSAVGGAPSATTEAAGPSAADTTSSAAPTTAAPTTAAPTTAPAVEPPASTSTTTDTPAGATGLAPADPDAPASEPVGVLGEGTVILDGSVPDEDLADAYARRLGELVGDESIVMHMAVDPRSSGETLRLDVDAQLGLPTASSPFDAEYEAVRDLAAAALDALPEATLVIEGHTDDIGDEATNLALSRAGAQLAAQWLVEQGIPADRITTTGAGETEPIADNGTPQGRQANRRLEVSIQGITPE